MGASSVSIRKITILLARWAAWSKVEIPLIYTLLVFKLAQDVEKKKAELKTPHFLSLNRDIVAWSQERKWGLKYDINSHISGRRVYLVTMKVKFCGTDHRLRWVACQAAYQSTAKK